MLESWESVQANQNVPLFVRGTFSSTYELHVQKHSPRSSWIEVKYIIDLGRTGMKKVEKMHALQCGPGCTSPICKKVHIGSKSLLFALFLHFAPTLGRIRIVNVLAHYSAKCWCKQNECACYKRPFVC